MKKVILTAMCLLAGIAASLPAQSENSVYQYCGDKNYVSPDNVSVSEAENQSEGLSELWWQNTAFYHIWIKSFKDSDGDGCGDLKGIQQNLDYIKDTVGCDGIWISPFFKCHIEDKDINMSMHGYDTTDYYAVNECFGNEQDVENLIKACHEKGIKIIFDFVPNHTSPGHKWFADFATGGEKKDWYVHGDKPLQWKTNMHESGWFNIPWYEGAEGKYFYGAFGMGMPDLNYRNYEVREEMKNVLRYWLNKGFDGVRFDAVRYLIETPESNMDTKETHQYYAEVRKDVIDAYSSPKFMLCEAWIENDRPLLEAYFGTEKAPEFNMIFDFDAGRPCYFSAEKALDCTENTLRSNPDSKKSYATFLGNHDLYESRPGTRLNGDIKKIKQATALSLLRPTVPFIYYGNELGEKNLDCSGDLALRGPFRMDFAESEKNDPDSVLNLNRTLLTLRKNYAETFAKGKIKKLTGKKDADRLAYTISAPEGTLLCLFNFSNSAISELNLKGLKGVTSASCIVGDTEAPAAVCGKGGVKIQNLAPCAYRVYLLNGDAENIWDDETYTAGETYTPVNDTSKLHSYAKSMYLRGSMNNWGGTPMKRSVENGNVLWTCDQFVKATYNQFKFCVNDSMFWGANWGNSEGQNFNYKFEGKTYRFVFNETTLECTFTAIE